MRGFKVKNVPTWIVCVTLVAAVVFMSVAIVVYAHGGYNCADAVQCTFQALEMCQSKMLFPRSWIDTTFAHLQTIPIWFGLRCSLSYVGANVIGGLVMYGALLLSLVYYWRKGARDDSGLIFALFVLLPASDLSLLQLYTGAFYSQCLIGMLVVLSTWSATCFPAGEDVFRISPRSLLASWLVTFVVCFLLGPRMLVVVCLPIAGGIIWMSVFDRPHVRGDGIRWMIGIGASLLLLAAAGVGCGGYENVLASAFGVPASVPSTDNLLRVVDGGGQVLSNFVSIVEGCMRVMGFPFACTMTGHYCIIGILGFVASTCLFVFFPILETCSYSRIGAFSRFLVVVAWIAVAGTTFILLFGHLNKGDEWNMCARYMLLPGMLLLMVGARYADRVLFRSNDVRAKIFACGLVFACALGMVERWRSVSNDYRASWQEVIDTLRSEGLKYGYATYENAFLPMFYSEGQIRIPHVVVGEGSLSVPGWCVAERWYDAAAHRGPTFLMLTEDELAKYAPAGLGKTLLGEPRRLLKIGKYNVLVYDYNIAVDLFGTMRGPVKRLWGFQGQWVRDGLAKMEVEIPKDMRAEDAELTLTVKTFGERVRVLSGTECLGEFCFPYDEHSWTAKTIRIPVRAGLLFGERLPLRIEATGVKSPYQRGWHKDKTKLGPCLEAVTIERMRKEKQS